MTEQAHGGAGPWRRAFLAALGAALGAAPGLSARNRPRGCRELAS